MIFLLENAMKSVHPLVKKKYTRIPIFFSLTLASTFPIYFLTNDGLIFIPEPLISQGRKPNERIRHKFHRSLVQHLLIELIFMDPAKDVGKILLIDIEIIVHHLVQHVPLPAVGGDREASPCLVDPVIEKGFRNLYYLLFRASMKQGNKKIPVFEAVISYSSGNRQPDQSPFLKISEELWIMLYFSMVL